jgi:predicted metalloprotease with PDZ domain
MKQLFLPFIITLFCSIASIAQPAASCPTYRYSVDLHHAPNDHLTVNLEMDHLETTKLIFRLPAMVPGIYGMLNFGKNVTRIVAFDADNQSLPVTQLDTNSWAISGKLRHLTYSVQDDWDDLATYGELVYRSPGSMFSEDDVFLINNNTLFGYFEGFDRCPLQVRFRKPDYLYAATSLTKTAELPEQVDFAAADYHELVDNPILFARPDTAHIQLGDLPVLVACYVTSKEKTAKDIAGYIEPLLRNQKAYLQGQLPVKNYTFIIYIHTTKNPNSSFGDGLEHAQSTVILNNMMYSKASVNRSVYGIASHEFFHTVMPLSLHSEEIEYYDFHHPVMSQHLWLYEGMTEYFTIHMPVFQHLETPEQFYQEIDGKKKTMEQFDSTLSLTNLGKQAVERQDQYLNAYNRGTLVCLCMDIRLREISNGKTGVQDLIQNLLLRYGRHSPFKDDRLFEEMAAVANDETLSAFLRRYLAGNELPPLATYFGKVGLMFGKDGKVQEDPHATEQAIRLREAWLGVK